MKILWQKYSEDYPRDPVKDEEPKQAPKDKYVRDIGETYARGRIDGMKWNDVTEYVNNLPVELQAKYAEGRGEEQATSIVGLIFAGIATGILADAAIIELRTFGIFKRVEEGIETVYHSVTNDAKNIAGFQITHSKVKLFPKSMKFSLIVALKKLDLIQRLVKGHIFIQLQAENITLIREGFTEMELNRLMWMSIE